MGSAKQGIMTLLGGHSHLVVLLSCKTVSLCLCVISVS